MILCKGEGGVCLCESKNLIMPAIVGKLFTANLVVMTILIKERISTAGEMFIL